MPGIQKTRDHTLKQLEDEINNSPYFTLKAENLEALRAKERANLMYAVYQYEHLQYTYRPEEFDVTVAECFNACTKPEAFDPQTGIPFLHYFNRSFKKALHQAKLDSMIDENSGGMHIPDNRRRIQRQVLKTRETLQKNGKDPESEESINLIAHALGIDFHDVCKIIDDVEQQKVQLEYYKKGGDNNDASVLDTIASNLSTFENKVDDSVYPDEIKEQFDKIERAVQAFRSDRKQILGKILTLFLTNDITRFQQFKEYKKEKYSFINYDLIEQYKERFSEKPPSQREIANLLGKKESEVSRAIHEFQDKLQTQL
jgi:DNA-directed RNA polymerase specialized sigma subunit